MNLDGVKLWCISVHSQWCISPSTANSSRLSNNIPNKNHIFKCWWWWIHLIPTPPQGTSTTQNQHQKIVSVNSYWTIKEWWGRAKIIACYHKYEGNVSGRCSSLNDYNARLWKETPQNETPQYRLNLLSVNTWIWWLWQGSWDVSSFHCDPSCVQI